MNRLIIIFGAALLMRFLSSGAPLAAQQCPAPPAMTNASTPSVFTPQQEVDLGDVEAERVERYARVIHDDALSDHLNRIVARIVAQLPPTELKFRVMLVDMPIVNAFSLPGGRIYVTRKLVAFARSDDELADLLSHEMGHILSHQGAIDMTRQLRQILGVASVIDRKDIAEKYNRMLDNIARNPGELQRLRTEEEPYQYQADQVALYALADAGYSPLTFADFFDRLAQTKGKSGGWFTDFLGMTTPNEKRLREIRKNMNDLPAPCRLQPATAVTQEFLSWQADVVAYAGLGRKAVLSGVLDKKILDPPLRNDMTHIRFSPDGKYLLAQDDSSIFVLSRDPLRVLFRVDALDSYAAQFSPDSQYMVFDTEGLRVEKWNVADGERESVHELAIPQGCNQSLLSPDGSTLACVNREFDLVLYDVAKGDVVFNKKACFAPNQSDIFAYWWQFLASLSAGIPFQWVRLGFSPDAKSFMGANLTTSIAVDLVGHGTIALHGALFDMAKGGFAFLAPDRVIAMNRHDLKNSAILGFPSGDVEKRLLLGGDRMSAAAHGNYLIIGPLKDYPNGVLNLDTNRFVFGSKDNYAVDEYDQIVAIQTRSGEIGLYDPAANKLIAHIPVSISPLGHLRAATISPDLNWVALSGTTRGAVWNISTSKRVLYTRGFHGAYFDQDATLIADFPKFESNPRAIVRLDLNGKPLNKSAPIDDKSTVRQWGRYLLSRRPTGKEVLRSRNEILEVSDVRSGNVLWSRTFPKEVPHMTLYSAADTLLIGWQAELDAAKDEIKNSPPLQSRMAAVHDRKSPYVLEVLDASTGTQRGALVVDTGKGSFRIETAYAVGDWVVLVDTNSRTLVYSVSTGEQKAAFFGTHSLLSPAAHMLALENEPGRVDLYSVPSFEKQGELVFSAPVTLWNFSDDGKRFFVLTSDQTAYTFDATRVTLTQEASSISAEPLKQ